MSTARRLRRHGHALFVGRKPIPAITAWVEANRSRFKAGQVAEVVVEHDHACRFPAGAPCTCRSGPEIRIRGERAEEN